MTVLSEEQFVHQTLNEGGASRHPVTGKAPEGGYMVGSASNAEGKAFPEQTYPADTFDVDHVRNHARAIRDHFGDKTAVYQGAWKQGHNVILDASERIEEQADAVRAGKIRGEQAIFDLKHGKDIKTTSY